MARNKIIWLGLFIGSTVGSFIPKLWGSGVLSFSSILLSAIGGILGVWLGFRLAE